MIKPLGARTPEFTQHLIAQNRICSNCQNAMDAPLRSPLAVRDEQGQILTILCRRCFMVRYQRSHRRPPKPRPPSPFARMLADQQFSCAHCGNPIGPGQTIAARNEHDQIVALICRSRCYYRLTKNNPQPKREPRPKNRIVRARKIHARRVRVAFTPTPKPHIFTRLEDATLRYLRDQPGQQMPRQDLLDELTDLAGPSAPTIISRLQARGLIRPTWMKGGNAGWQAASEENERESRPQ